MGTVSRSVKSGTGTTAFGGGTKAVASEVNTDFNTLYSCLNGEVDNFNIKAGANINASKLDLSTIVQNVDITGTLDISGALTCDSLQLTNAVVITSILDEDTMASDTTAALCTQQSIKAYVDAEVSGLTIDALLPDQSAASGKFLTSDGSNASWGTATQTATTASGSGGSTINASSSVTITPGFQASAVWLTVRLDGSGFVSNGFYSSTPSNSCVYFTDTSGNSTDYSWYVAADKYGTINTVGATSFRISNLGGANAAIKYTWLAIK